MAVVKSDGKVILNKIKSEKFTRKNWIYLESAIDSEISDIPIFG